MRCQLPCVMLSVAKHLGPASGGTPVVHRPSFTLGGVRWVPIPIDVHRDGILAHAVHYFRR